MDREENDSSKKDQAPQAALKLQHDQAMQNYLQYLKSDSPLADHEESQPESSSKEWWITQVMYPPFED